MPSLIDMRRRIRSVKNTQQITKAMKMVSAAKLRRAQSRVVASRPYGALLRKVLANVAAAAPSSGEGDGSNPLLDRRPEERILLVVVTSDKGLAGAFNANLIKGAQHLIKERSGAAVQLELIGRKGRDFFRKRHAAILGEHVGLAAKSAYADTAAIARKAADLFRGQEIDAVYLLYNEFRSVSSQKMTVERVLPVEMPGQQAAPVDYIFDTPPAEMLADLLPRYVEMEFYRALLESTASEHAARMMAMEAATSNAGEMIEKLTLFMNRVRQASITKEIIEVVSGAASAE
jgi:F-type H+-transporting ATPase subunit gamma